MHEIEISGRSDASLKSWIYEILYETAYAQQICGLNTNLSNFRCYNSRDAFKTNAKTGGGGSGLPHTIIPHMKTFVRLVILKIIGPICLYLIVSGLTFALTLDTNKKY